MEEPEFLAALLGAAPDHLTVGALRKAREETFREPRAGFYQQDVATVIERAGELEGPAPTTRQVFSAQSGPRERVTRDLLCDRLEPVIRQIRWLLDLSTPMGEYEAGVWLKNELDKAGAGTAGTGGVALQYPKRWDQHGDVVAAEARVGPGTPLARIVDLYSLYSVRVIARNTGFQEAAVLWWVLTGRRPRIPRLRVEQYSGHPFIGDQEWGDKAVSWITLEIYARDLSWEELWQAYTTIRDKANFAKRQKTIPMHDRIYKLVQEQGGVPTQRGRKTAFWEGIRQELEAEGVWRVPSTWQAVRKAYVNLVASANLDGGAEKPSLDYSATTDEEILGGIDPKALAEFDALVGESRADGSRDE